MSHNSLSLIFLCLLLLQYLVVRIVSSSLRDIDMMHQDLKFSAIFSESEHARDFISRNPIDLPYRNIDPIKLSSVSMGNNLIDSSPPSRQHRITSPHSARGFMSIAISSRTASPFEFFKDSNLREPDDMNAQYELIRTPDGIFSIRVPTPISDDRNNSNHLMNTNGDIYVNDEYWDRLCGSKELHNNGSFKPSKSPLKKKC
jgi:hypothetical protein